MKATLVILLLVLGLCTGTIIYICNGNSPGEIDSPDTTGVFIPTKSEDTICCFNHDKIKPVKLQCEDISYDPIRIDVSK